MQIRFVQSQTFIICFISYVYLYFFFNIEGCQSYVPDGHTTNQPARIYNNVNWYYLCHEFIDIVDANVICRENGYKNGAESVVSVYRPQLAVGYQIYPYKVNCVGDEKSLCDCTHILKQCNSDYVVAIKCKAPGKLVYILIHSSRVHRLSWQI